MGTQSGSLSNGWYQIRMPILDGPSNWSKDFSRRPRSAVIPGLIGLRRNSPSFTPLPVLLPSWKWLHGRRGIRSNAFCGSISRRESS